MHRESNLDVEKLFEETLGERMKEYDLPAPSYSVMETKIIEFDKEKDLLTIKMPIRKTWLNPYDTMQGGMIIGAMDNAVGPLSMLIAPLNMTRSIDSKLKKAITMDLEFIYITAKLLEWKKRRLTFDVVVKDRDGEIYASATMINWIIEEK